MFDAFYKSFRINPTRVAVVFYQHYKLNNPQHGHCHYQERKGKSVNDDYEAWLKDDFTPTKRQLKIMRDMGYPMPENTRTRARNQKRK